MKTPSGCIRIKIIQKGYMVYHYFPIGVSVIKEDVESFPFDELVCSTWATAEEKKAEYYKPERARLQ